MTISIQTVYDAFLASITEDEWVAWTEEEVQADLYEIYKLAKVWFKFPRVSLELNADGNFIDENISNEEVQILAAYMVVVWLRRTIESWENVKPLYEERDFSQANLINKLNENLEANRKYADRLERTYYRSIQGKPYRYSDWAKN